jgi:hypothetical protein
MVILPLPSLSTSSKVGGAAIDAPAKMTSITAIAVFFSMSFSSILALRKPSCRLLSVWA